MVATCLLLRAPHMASFELGRRLFHRIRFGVSSPRRGLEHPQTSDPFSLGTPWRGLTDSPWRWRGRSTSPWWRRGRSPLSRLRRLSQFFFAAAAHGVCLCFIYPRTRRLCFTGLKRAPCGKLETNKVRVHKPRHGRHQQNLGARAARASGLMQQQSRLAGVL
jgi:hypothetical protein